MPVGNLKYTGDFDGGSVLKQDAGHRSEQLLIYAFACGK